MGMIFRQLNKLVLASLIIMISSEYRHENDYATGRQYFIYDVPPAAMEVPANTPFSLQEINPGVYQYGFTNPATGSYSTNITNAQGEQQPSCPPQMPSWQPPNTWQQPMYTWEAINTTPYTDSKNIVAVA